MLQYETLRRETADRIAADRAAGWRNPYACPDAAATRRDPAHDKATVLRPAFIRDTEKILNCPYYNRYADKTQVFSLYRNDDITRRALHVQLVSRIARTIGGALGLNLDLIEAIALGHDIGHTPFGHAGEKYLDEIYAEHTGRHFSHNIHSVRVLDGIFPHNLTLHTLSGIASHDGELELGEYRPRPLTDFAEFDEQIEACYQDKDSIRQLVPSTLEGCVVRISDIIAYLGKDRQDAGLTRLVNVSAYEESGIGTLNAEIINNLSVNIVENSYGKPFIRMDDAHFAALQQAKRDNYDKIYFNDAVREVLDRDIRPMIRQLYERLLEDLRQQRRDSAIYTHHLAYVDRPYYRRARSYTTTDPNQIVVDFIASMTDDYLIDLYERLFPHSEHKIVYKGYFDA